MRRASLAVLFFVSVIFFIPQSVSADVSIHVRYQDEVAFEGSTTIPDLATTTLNDSSGNPHDISSQSALYLLSLASASTSSRFSISDLQYYDSFDAFYVNCIDIATTTPIHACGNWQYAINNVPLIIGSDKYIATTSDDIYFYYGNQRQFSVSTTSTDIATPIVVTAQKYDFLTNSWSPLPETVVDATQPDPENPWSPFIIASSTTDTDGVASLLFANAGTYNIGLRDDGYYPTAITVASSTESTADNQEETDPTNTGNGGNGGGQIQIPIFNTDSAIQFLISQQKSDGSFGSALYTDWAAIGISAYPGQNEAKQKLISYLTLHTDSGSLVTDFERRAMALMALGVNPYSGTSVDYIKNITDSFDGTQIGDSNLCNDDIFALFPLMKAGYTTNDLIIQKITSFIISDTCVQKLPDGSFYWNGIDMTAAAIQALSQVASLPNVSSSLAKAEQYLRNIESGKGFGNSPATSWALQAIPSIGQNSLSLLVNLQQADGGVEPVSENCNTDCRVWATSYAIPAVLGKSWPNILKSFPKPTSIQQPQTQTQASQPTNPVVSLQNATSSTLIIPTTIATSSAPIIIAAVKITKPAVLEPEKETFVSTSSLKSEPEPVQETQTAAISSASGATEKKPWLLASGIIVIIAGLAYYFRSAFPKNL